MNKWQRQVYDMLRAASRNNLPCTIPADVTHIPANMMLEADRMRWISVKDRLPEESSEVLFVLYGKVYLGDYLLNEAFETPAGSVFLADEAVTHWMPLPEAPKEDEK